MFTSLKTLLVQSWQTVFIALRALRRNKMRSTLTALGIIIGVASVVTMVAVGNGAQARITSEVSALGQNLLMIFAGSRRAGGVSSGLGSASTMTLADADAIVNAIAPEPRQRDVVAILSNGGFGGVYEKLPQRLRSLRVNALGVKSLGVK